MQLYPLTLSLHVPWTHGFTGAQSFISEIGRSNCVYSFMCYKLAMYLIDFILTCTMNAWVYRSTIIYVWNREVKLWYSFMCYTLTMYLLDLTCTMNAWVYRSTIIYVWNREVKLWYSFMCYKLAMYLIDFILTCTMNAWVYRSTIIYVWNREVKLCIQLHVLQIGNVPDWLYPYMYHERMGLQEHNHLCLK